MDEFFKPIRRKVGVATLALACAFTSVWVRGLEMWPEAEGFELRMEFRKAGIDFNLVHMHYLNDRTTDESSLVFDIPYVSIVIPLTLLSAYLVLSKPRTSTQKDVTEPNTETAS